MKGNKIIMAMALVGTLGLSLMGTASADGTAVVTITPPTVIAGDIITLQADVSDPHGLWLVAVYIDGSPDPLTNGTLSISTGGTFYKPSAQ